jgi:hypothetical protein
MRKCNNQLLCITQLFSSKFDAVLPDLLMAPLNKRQINMGSGQTGGRLSASGIWATEKRESMRPFGCNAIQLEESPTFRSNTYCFHVQADGSAKQEFIRRGHLMVHARPHSTTIVKTAS